MTRRVITVETEVLRRRRRAPIWRYTLTIDAQPRTEFGETVQANPNVWDEFRASQRGDPSVEMEFRGNLAILGDPVVAFEFRGTQLRDDIPPLEFLHRAGGDPQAPLEYVAGLRGVWIPPLLGGPLAGRYFAAQLVFGLVGDSIMPLETRAVASLTDSILPMEWVGRVVQDAFAWEEFVLTAAGNPLVGVETVAGQRGDPRTQTESSGTSLGDAGAGVESGALQRLDMAPWLEFGLSVRGDATGWNEFRSAVGANPGLAVEWRGVVGAVTDAGVQVEARGTLRGDAFAPVEFTLNLSGDARVSGEFLAGQRVDPAVLLEYSGLTLSQRDSGLLLEFLASALRDELLRGEWLDAVSLDRGIVGEWLRGQAGDGSAPGEFGANQRQDTAPLAESSGSQKRDDAPEAESAGSQTRDMSDTLEALTGLRGDSASALESLGNALRRDWLVVLEWAGALGAGSDSRAAVEFAATVSADPRIAVEGLSAVAAFPPLALEALGQLGLVGDSLAPLEALAFVRRAAVSGALPFEFLLAARNDPAVWAEVLPAVLRAGVSAVEFLPLVYWNPPLSAEFRGTSRADSGAFAEILSSALRDQALVGESASVVLARVGPQAEWISILRADSELLGEFMANVLLVLDSGALLEFSGVTLLTPTNGWALKRGPLKVNLPPVLAGSVHTFGVDFGNLMALGDQLEYLLTVTVFAEWGSDPGAQGRLLGIPQIGTIAMQYGGTGIRNAAVVFQVGNCVAGVNYVVSILAPTQSGNVLDAAIRFECVSPF